MRSHSEQELCVVDSLGINGVLLWTRLRTFAFHIKRQICSVAGRISISLLLYDQLLQL